MHPHRFFETLKHLASFTDTPGQGVTRFSWSNSAKQASLFLSQELQAMGLMPYEDGIGNLRAIMKGTSTRPRIIIGSHLDSVRNGGSLDGAYGTVAALEVLRSLHEENIRPNCDIEFIAFAEEEGSNFGLTCMGSKAITGHLNINTLKQLHNTECKKAYDILRDFGLDPDALPKEQINPASVAMYLEAHIEQGGRLEAAGKSIGIVSAISGMRLTAFRLVGKSNHAASPMQGRHDPMAAFAEMAYRLEGLWREGQLPGDMSCTVGKIECHPNVGIVVPEEVRFTVDLRHVEIPHLEKARQTVTTMIREVARQREILLEEHLLSESGGVPMAPAAIDVLSTATREMGVTPELMVSGPAHDAAPMGRVVPAGMLFVPSIAGLSHCPQEDTHPEDLELGVRILEKAVRSIACQGQY